MLLKEKFQLTVPLETRGMECHAGHRGKHQCQEGTREKHRPQSLLGVSVEKAKWDWENSLGLAGLNNSGGL